MEHAFRSINNFASMYRHRADMLKPDIRYVLKPKIHGSNASILITPDGIECRSKNRILSEDDDHMNFCKSMGMIEQDWMEYTMGADWCLVMGEWAGKGVQREDAVSLLEDKKYFVFAVMFPSGVYSTALGVDDFFRDNDMVHEVPPVQYLDIPFDPSKDLNTTINTINAEVAKFEVEDPYIKALFDISGTGEGIVGTPANCRDFDEYFNYAFKAKTEAHRVKKTSLPASVREPLPQEAFEFANMYVTEARLKQCIHELRIEIPEMRFTPQVIQWMSADILKESMDDVEQMELEIKSLMKVVNTKIVQIWKGYVHGQVG